MAEGARVTREMQVGEDLFVMILPITGLKERDVNHQVMQPRHLERLAENIKARGQVESLPYVVWPNREGTPEILSGHHRTRAARLAGLDEIPCLVDTQPMTESRRIAVQVAHNELHGTPDETILRRMVEQIDNVDDLLTTGLSDDWLPVVEKEPAKLLVPHADFDWRLVSLAFLPAQIEDISKTLDLIDKHSEIVGIGDRSQFEDFSEAIVGYSRLKNIRSMAMTFAYLAQLANHEIQAATDGPTPLDVAVAPDEDGSWINISRIVGVAMPPDAAFVFATAVRMMMDRGDITNAWQALELLAADYIAGGR